MFVSPIRLTILLWAAWVLSWVIAGAWSAQTRTRLPYGQQLLHWLPTVGGMALLFRSATLAGFEPARIHPLYDLPPAIGWILTAVGLAGFAFTWWARMHLGSLWSADIQQKQDHRIVDTGPYGVVRHPIYTGLLMAALVLAVQAASATALAGFALVAIGFTLKALMEERFLAEALGADAYAGYRARIPMLIPFAPF